MASKAKTLHKSAASMMASIPSFQLAALAASDYAAYNAYPPTAFGVMPSPY